MKTDDARKILFVYNADATLRSDVRLFFTKLLAPAKYPCKLCAITYGNFTMRRSFRRFLGASPHSVIMLHRDEFRARFHDDTPLPAVFELLGDQVRIILSADDLGDIGTVDALVSRVESAIVAS